MTIIEESDRVVGARRLHGRRQCKHSGRGIEYLPFGDVTFPGHQNCAVVEQRGGVICTRRFQAAGEREFSLLPDRRVLADARAEAFPISASDQHLSAAEQRSQWVQSESSS